jgi:hypothetical protein
MLTNQQNNTDQKLRIAAFHLTEIAKSYQAAIGDDFSVAHYEAFLAQLFGAYDSFLQEVNQFFGFELSPTQVTLNNLSSKSTLVQKPIFDELTSLVKDPNSWFGQAKRFRNHTTHVNRVGITYHVGGPNSGKSMFRDPSTTQTLEPDILSLLKTWLSEMEQLISRLRSIM